MGSQRIVLSADAASVMLDSECEGVVRWTTEYLGAWWDVSTTSSTAPAGAPRVQAVLDRGEHDRIAGDLAQDGVPCLAFMGAAGLRRASADGTSVWAAIPEQGVCFQHDRSLREVRIVSGDARALRSATTRLAREMIALQLQARGWCLVHAAGVAKDGRAVLVLGGKGSGKTAAALTLAAALGWALLANDRVLLRVTGTEVTVCSWPSSCRLGLGLVAALGWGRTLRERTLADAVQVPNQPREITEAIAAGDLRPVRAASGKELKSELMPVELAAWFGFHFQGRGRLAALLFPRVDLDREAAEPRTVTPGASVGHHDLDVAGKEALYPDFLDLSATLGAGRGDPDLDALNASLAALPHVEATLGPSISSNGQALAALESRVLAPR